VTTTDCGFPEDPKSRAFLNLWIKMFDESQREMKYSAKLAGREFAISPSAEGFAISFFGFNASFTEFQIHVFKELEYF
jgi:secreted Zn-dependent insulinase-like peptidase